MIALFRLCNLQVQVLCFFILNLTTKASDTSLSSGTAFHCTELNYMLQASSLSYSCLDQLSAFLRIVTRFQQRGYYCYEYCYRNVLLNRIHIYMPVRICSQFGNTRYRPRWFFESLRNQSNWCPFIETLQQLLIDHCIDFEIILHKCSLHDPQPKLLKRCCFVSQYGHQS